MACILRLIGLGSFVEDRYRLTSADIMMLFSGIGVTSNFNKLRTTFPSVAVPTPNSVSFPPVCVGNFLRIVVSSILEFPWIRTIVGSITIGYWRSLSCNHAASGIRSIHNVLFSLRVLRVIS